MAIEEKIVIRLDSKEYLAESRKIAGSSEEAGRKMMALEAEARKLQGALRAGKIAGDSPEELRKMSAALDENAAKRKILGTAVLEQGRTSREDIRGIADAEREAAREVARQEKERIRDEKTLARETEKARKEADSARKTAEREAKKESDKAKRESEKAAKDEDRQRAKSAADANRDGVLKAAAYTQIAGAALDAAKAIASATAELMRLAGMRAGLDAVHGALMGSAEAGRHMGNQVAELATRVPQGVKELDSLAVSLEKTRLSGPAVVDAMNAIAQATAGIDGSAGNKLQEILTRNARTGRMRIGVRELEGTGLDLRNVADEYAKLSGRSYDQAIREITSGRASVETGAKALRIASEKAFGDANVSRIFSDPDRVIAKAKDSLIALGRDVNLKPLEESGKRILDSLKPGGESGRAIAASMEAAAAVIGPLAEAMLPVVVELLEDGSEAVLDMALFATDLILTWREAGDAIKGALDPSTFEAAGEAIDWILGGLKEALRLASGLGFLDPVFKAAESLRDVREQVEEAGGWGNAIRNDLDRLGITSPASSPQGGAGSNGVVVEQITMNITANGADAAEAVASPGFQRNVENAGRNGAKGVGL